MPPLTERCYRHQGPSDKGWQHQHSGTRCSAPPKQLGNPRLRTARHQPGQRIGLDRARTARPSAGHQRSGTAARAAAHRPSSTAARAPAARPKQHPPPGLRIAWLPAQQQAPRPRTGVAAQAAHRPATSQGSAPGQGRPPERARCGHLCPCKGLSWAGALALAAFSGRKKTGAGPVE